MDIIGVHQAPWIGDAALDARSTDSNRYPPLRVGDHVIACLSWGEATRLRGAGKPELRSRSLDLPLEVAAVHRSAGTGAVSVRVARVLPGGRRSEYGREFPRSHVVLVLRGVSRG